MKKRLIPLFLGFLLLASTACVYGGTTSHAVVEPFPTPLEAYQDNDYTSLWEVLKHRVQYDSFNLIATLIFLAAVVHTFMAAKFSKMAHVYDVRHQEKLKAKGHHGEYESVSFRAEILHFLGEVEAIFGIWVIPLIFTMIYYEGKDTVLHYFNSTVNYNEPIFVVIVMAIASTKPVLQFAENALRKVAAIGKGTPGAWWLSILTIAPILGSFITEPAAMTIGALLLGMRFYRLQPSGTFSYATLGLLFVNVSVGGTLTHFAAPPVLMVASTWSWDLPFMFINFGWKAVTGIIVSNGLFWFFFRKELKALNEKVIHEDDDCKLEGNCPLAPSIPFWVTCVHLFFLAFTVIYLHYPVFYIGGFLFFLAFTQATVQYQYKISLKGPLLVGFFLAGLVTHGGLQQWWIEPVLSRMGETVLFLGSTTLTAFNDNAAITYLASLVPEFADNLRLQLAVVEGAVVGGGLTVIANAPNPAGQSILARYFKDGVSPLKLFLSALIPTIIMALSFRLFT